MAFQTEFDFELPRGYLDSEGSLHKKGRMRLATAADEIVPMKDPRVQQNPNYLSIILLSRVVTKLGELKIMDTMIVERLFTADLAYLQDFYQRINQADPPKINVTCPHCQQAFEADILPLGE